MPSMAWALLALIAIVLAVIQHGALAHLIAAPDLPLALAAWAMVDGDERWLLVRAWMIGTIRDAIDPGSVCFHAIGCLLLAIGMLGLRGILFRARGAAWGAWGAACVFAVHGFDRWWSGGGGGMGALVATALLTALATVGLGWLLGGLPGPLRPVPRAGA